MHRIEQTSTTAAVPNSRLASGFIALIALLAIEINLVAGAGAQEPINQSIPKGKSEMRSISGEFEVKISPVDTGDALMGMMMLDKTYHGALKATGKGRMLTGMTAIKDSAAYVAMERIDGELDGKRGSFLVYHTGTMNKGKQSLTIRVVPDSGTDELLGLEGTMEIRIVERKHFYDFRYDLGEAKVESK